MTNLTLSPSKFSSCPDHRRAVEGLLLARDSLMRFGWRQGDSRVGEEATLGLCMGGAVARVFGLVDDDGDAPTWDSFTAVGRDAARTFHREDWALPLPRPVLLVQRWMYEAALPLPDLDPDLPPEVFMHGDGSVHDNLRHWNDDPKRTREEVLELIDAALAIALRNRGDKVATKTSGARSEAVTPM